MVPSKQKSRQTIKLYGYQKVAFKKLVLALRSTFRALLVMATGLGKTFLSIEVVKEFITPKDKVLFLCHENGILNKSYKDYQKYFGNQYSYAKFYGKNKDWEADKHNFVFATFQSILGHLGNAKQKKKLFSRKHFSFVVVDESHHSQAETFAEVIDYFKSKYKLGMTATPDREDQMDIRDIFGEAVVDIRLPEAIAKGLLTPIDYKVLSDGLDEDKIREVCEEVLIDSVRLTENQINEKIFIKVRTEEQCKIIRRYSKTRKAIVFCENIEHLNHVASILPSSVTVHSKQSNKINDVNFELFENGHVRHVVVVDKFNEGIDIPDTEMLCFLRGTDSERIFLQQLGRGLRKFPGKEKVTILDFVGNIERIKQVSKLVRDIKEFSKTKKQNNNQAFLDPIHVDGEGFNFDFSSQIVDLLSVLERLDQDLYKTWQEASVASIKLGIGENVSNLLKDYHARYKIDPQLPSDPHKSYADFPGYRVFLNKEKYSTWQEASIASIKIGIGKNADDLIGDYSIKYKQDKRLPSSPAVFYSDFPGFKIFLGKENTLEKYPTWKEASIASIKLRIGKKEMNLKEDYRAKYKKDPKLPSNPNKSYSDFPGYKIFLGKENPLEKYTSWKEASKAAVKLGIGKKGGDLTADYQANYNQDPRLPSDPNKFYADFPGFKVFLKKKRFV